MIEYFPDIIKIGLSELIGFQCTLRIIALKSKTIWLIHPILIVISLEDLDNHSKGLSSLPQECLYELNLNFDKRNEDEDGDLVAVRTNEELTAMLSSSRIHPLKIHLISEDEPLLDGNLASIMPDMLKRLDIVAFGYSGTVYKALDVEHDRIVALKCISVDGCKEQFIIAREVQLLRKVSIPIRIINELKKKYSCSPYIVNFLSAALLDGELCLSMEFMDGGSLDRYKKLPISVLVPAAISIICGLHYLWINNVMHRDIKPSNILVNSRGDVKISDFGISKQLEQSVARSFVGTNIYMAPERMQAGTEELYLLSVNDLEYSKQKIQHFFDEICSDIWSFGLTICELAIGKFPLIMSTCKNVSASVDVIFDKNFDIMDCFDVEHLPTDFMDVLRNWCNRKIHFVFKSVVAYLPECLHCIHNTEYFLEEEVLLKAWDFDEQMLKITFVRLRKS
ncbi:kinase domain protein [Onchocerca flexuosa]|uniref:mitogen-activated protein kinase kinase n=1 Tax=Onchocerca flexuosa TaxID=387005 RepID=A0A238C696_9BILA|nr:kinase domain protein [Onchocerca flexuosa]